MLDPMKIQKVRFSDATQAAGSFLSAYDLKITVDGQFVVEVGRFSFALLERAFWVAPTSVDGPILKIGAFCEAAQDGTILIGAEHPNSTLFNYTFGPSRLYPIAAGLDLTQLLEPMRPTVIGDNVLLSYRTTVLAGSAIGDGSVIAAGAVVSGQLAPFGIYGGVPAKQIRDRFPAEMQQLFRDARIQDVCAHHVTGLPKLLSKLADGAMTVENLHSEISYLRRRPTLHMAATINEHKRLTIGRPTGYFIGDELVEDATTVARLNHYFGQVGPLNTELEWVPDIFHFLGLYS